MPREINLTSIGGWVNLKKNGTTIHVRDEKNEDCCGRLRVGAKVHWRPAGKGQIERSKSWEELVNFFMSTT